MIRSRGKTLFMQIFGWRIRCDPENVKSHRPWLKSRITIKRYLLVCWTNSIIQPSGPKRNIKVVAGQIIRCDVFLTNLTIQISLWLIRGTMWVISVLVSSMISDQTMAWPSTGIIWMRLLGTYPMTSALLSEYKCRPYQKDQLSDCPHSKWTKMFLKSARSCLAGRQGDFLWTGRQYRGRDDEETVENIREWLGQRWHSVNPLYLTSWSFYCEDKSVKKLFFDFVWHVRLLERTPIVSMARSYML